MREMEEVGRGLEYEVMEMSLDLEGMNLADDNPEKAKIQAEIDAK